MGTRKKQAAWRLHLPSASELFYVFEHDDFSTTYKVVDSEEFDVDTEVNHQIAATINPRFKPGVSQTVTVVHPKRLTNPRGRNRLIRGETICRVYLQGEGRLEEQDAIAIGYASWPFHSTKRKICRDGHVRSLIRPASVNMRTARAVALGRAQKNLAHRLAERAGIPLRKLTPEKAEGSWDAYRRQTVAYSQRPLDGEHPATPVSEEAEALAV